mgnify:FL=1
MMKNLITSLLLLTICSSAFSQATVAMDWTKTDCVAGNTYNLFDVLNSNKVVVQEYVMMDCAPCITAGNVLMDLLSDYAITNPGEIVTYQTAFDNFTDCSTLSEWATDNGFTATTLFTMGDDEINYYGAMGMPTILIFGGGENHTVYYYHLGSISSAVSQEEFTTALDLALAETDYTVGIENTLAVENIISPNPAVDVINISSADNVLSYTIIDITGKTMMTTTSLGNTQINISGLTPGVYSVIAKAENGTVNSTFFVKQ